MKKRIKQLPRMIYIEIDLFSFLLLSWTLKSRKRFSKAEEEHGGTFDLSSFGSLSLSAMLHRKSKALSPMVACTSVTLLRLSEASKVKACKAIMCLFVQSDLERSQGGLASPSH